MVKSKTLTVTAERAVVPPPPVGWTHRLELKFYRMAWANKASVEGAITATLVPVINAFEWLVGYDYLGYTLDWEGMVLNLYYKQRASPVITAAVLLAALKIIVVLIFAVGVLILAIAWYEREKRIAAESLGKKELLDEGKITSEQYEELVKAQKEEPAPWEKVVVPVALILLALVALAVLPKVKPPEEEFERVKERRR